VRNNALVAVSIMESPGGKVHGRAIAPARDSTLLMILKFRCLATAGLAMSWACCARPCGLLLGIAREIGEPPSSANRSHAMEIVVFAVLVLLVATVVRHA
jgi:hypothetical protein